MYIPSITVTKNIGDKAWFDDKCRHAAKRKRNVYPQLKKCSTPANRKMFTSARWKYNQAERQAKRNYNIKLRKDLTCKGHSSNK